MTRILTIIALLLATPAWAAGSYGYEPSASRLINDAKKLIKKEKYKRAIEKLEKAKKEEPDNADVFNYLGFAYRKIGNYHNSKVFYEEALAIQPDHKLALEYQGELFLALHDPNSAQSNLIKLTALCPQGCDELQDLGTAFFKYITEHSD
jgi:tetratricopeptide (TPR) repeat protein